MAAHQAPPSLGFSRQEHWSGLPFLSPMHESQKWKWNHFSRVQLCATPQTAAQQVPPCLGFSRQELWSGFPFPYLMFHKFSRYVEAHISWKKGTINRIESRSFLKLLDSLQSSISLTTQTLGRKLSPWSISPFPLFQTLLLNLFLQWAV